MSGGEARTKGGAARPNWLAPLLLWLLSATVLAGAASHCLGCDEPQTANIVQFSHTWGEMLTHLRSDVNAPVVYVIFKLWTALFGSSDASFKVCAVLIATLVPPAVFLGLRPGLGARLSAEVALCTALCASFVHHGQLVRSYGLVILLGWLATLSLSGLWREPQNRRRQISYTLLLILIPYTHLSGFLVWAGHAFASLTERLRRALLAANFLVWLVCLLIAALAVCPLFLTRVTDREFAVIQGGVAPLTLLITLPRLVLTCGAGANTPSSVLCLAVIFWAMLTVCWIKRRDIKERYPQFAVRMWLLLTTGMILGEAVVATQLLRETYVVHLIVPFLIVIVLGLEFLLTRLPVFLRTAAPLLVLVPFWLWPLVNMHERPMFGAALACARINREANRLSVKPLLVVSRQWYATAVARYLDKEIPYICLPTLEAPRIIDYSRTTDIQPMANLPSLYKILDKSLSGGISVYHLRAKPDGTIRRQSADARDMKASEAVESWLENHAKRQSETVFADCAGQMLLSCYTH